MRRSLVFVMALVGSGAAIHAQKDAVYAVDRDGKPTATHTYWKGFERGTAVGLVLEHARP